ncbi:hypothetical protein BWQ96_08414 [Gracilariopsis chorda]|uniref:Uncharacterized protein n=1 Tax=Gracilariopsis chorda TaxID=448386 RepID=A0A2V3IIJ0_9FLOR|nr:hypothetical protein BWQ96_08414 [Gracilariopsis chorda]|eukprot:PXF41879.1 hypothetical protein BWQ96_08414 [Gracilariopsis chorda]
MGKQLLLNLSPSVWNVLKWALFTLVITPAFEIMTASLMASSATARVQAGAQLELFDSQLGIFALHSRYAGKRRTRLWLVLGTAVLMALELWLEMSFSAAEVVVTVSEEVWVGPNHDERYMRRENFSINDEPTRLLETMSRQCIAGPRAMKRDSVQRATVTVLEEAEVIAQYSLTANWTVRAAYVREEDSLVACDAVAETKWASVEAPNIVSQYGVEGFHSDCDPALGLDSEWFQTLHNESFTQRGAFVFEGERARAYSGTRATCVELDAGVDRAEDIDDVPLRLVCALQLNSTVAITLTAGLNIARCVALLLHGPGVETLAGSHARQLRLLAFVAETRILWPGWSNTLKGMVQKRSLERVAMAALMVSGERAVSGVAERRERRRVTQSGGQVRQVATVDTLAVVPLVALGALGALLAVCDVVLRLRRRTTKRVQMSSPWVAAVVAVDAQRLGVYGDSPVRLRLQLDRAAGRVRVLPPLMSRAAISHSHAISQCSCIPSVIPTVPTSKV